MGTNSNNDKVKHLFQIFQQQREQATHVRQQTIMDKLHPSKTAPHTEDRAVDEQAVVDQYRRFMSERDGGREEFIAQMTAYAKSKVDADAAEQRFKAKPAVSPNDLPGLFQWPGHALSRIRERLSMVFSGGLGQWQIVLPALAMFGVVLWLTQTVEYSLDNSQTVAWNDSLPVTVADNAQGILNTLQPTVQPTLGFTQHSGILSAGFELGQAMAYIELALAAQSEKHVLGMVKRADNLASSLGLRLLSTQVDLQEDTVSLNSIAQGWFDESSELTTHYQLGYWMETTRFVMQLTESTENLVPIIEQLTLLKERRPMWEKELQQDPLQLRQFRKLADLDSTSLQTHYGRQVFTRQLERTIAVFKNL